MNCTTLASGEDAGFITLNKFKNRATFAAHHIMTIGLHQMAVGILRQIQHMPFLLLLSQRWLVCWHGIPSRPGSLLALRVKP
jgi:hypothetical protein